MINSPNRRYRNLEQVADRLERLTARHTIGRLAQQRLRPPDASTAARRTRIAGDRSPDQVHRHMGCCAAAALVSHHDARSAGAAVLVLLLVVLLLLLVVVVLLVLAGGWRLDGRLVQHLQQLVRRIVVVVGVAECRNRSVIVDARLLVVVLVLARDIGQGEYCSPDGRAG